MFALEQKVAQAEEALVLAQKNLQTVAGQEIPDLMDELGVSDFTTHSGIRVRIVEAIRASIPKERTEEAVAWLDDHNFHDLVKRKFTVQFGADEEAWANKFAADLARRKRQLAVAQDKTVHTSTLSAWVRSQLENGEDVPLDLFGVHRQRKARVDLK